MTLVLTILHQPNTFAELFAGRILLDFGEKKTLHMVAYDQLLLLVIISTKHFRMTDYY